MCGEGDVGGVWMCQIYMCVFVGSSDVQLYVRVSGCGFT